MATDPPPPRTRSARLTLVSLLLIPLLSLAALWGFIASITLGNVIRYQHYNTAITTIAPSVIALAADAPGRARDHPRLAGHRAPVGDDPGGAARPRGTAPTSTSAAVRSAVMSVRGLLSTNGQRRR